MSQTAAPVQKSNLEDLFKSANLPACLIGRCCSCFGSWIVLIPLFSLLLTPTPLLLYSSAPLLLYSSAPDSTPLLLYFSTPLLLYSFLPSSRSTTLVVPVANDTAYSITVVYKYSSQDAHGTDQPVLIGYAFHWLFEPLPFYGFVFAFLSSSSPSFLFCALAGFHLECTSNSLGATSLWPAGLPEAMK